MTKKTIIVLGGGEQQIPVIHRAHSLGYDVACADINEDAPGLALVKYPLAKVSTHDPEDVIYATKNLKSSGTNIAGIVAVAVEASHTVAAVGEFFGFNTISSEVSARCTDKISRLKCFQRHGVPCPRFGTAQNKIDAIQVVHSIGYPVVLKPTNKAGALGVVIVKNDDELNQWFDYTFEKNNNIVLIEEYLEGTEHSSESLVINNNIYTTGFSDRNYDTKHLYPPHLLENGDTLPTELSDMVFRETLNAIEKAIRSLGINVGAAKGDIIVTKQGQPKILEMAARVSGDYFASFTVPAHNGTDLISALLQQASDDQVNKEFLTPKMNRGVALRYLWPKPGKIISISGFEEAQNKQDVLFVNWEPYWVQRNIEPGVIITPPVSHRERVGCVLCQAETREKAIQLAEETVSSVKIITKEEK